MCSSMDFAAKSQLGIRLVHPERCLISPKFLHHSHGGATQNARCFAVSQTGYYIADEVSVKCTVIVSRVTTVIVTQRDIVFFQTISSIRAITDLRIRQMTRELFSNDVIINAAFNLIVFKMRFEFRVPTSPEAFAVFLQQSIV